MYSVARLIVPGAVSITGGGLCVEAGTSGTGTSGMASSGSRHFYARASSCLELNLTKVAVQTRVDCSQDEKAADLRWI